jgi:hypothetical protein
VLYSVKLRENKITVVNVDNSLTGEKAIELIKYHFGAANINSIIPTEDKELCWFQAMGGYVQNIGEQGGE